MTSTVRATKINTQSIQEVRQLVSENHDIAWLEAPNTDFAKGNLAFTGQSSIIPNFQAMSLEQLFDKDDPKAARARMAYIKLGMNATSFAGQYFPGVLEQPIEGMEFILTTAEAVEAWSDPERTSDVQASLATGRAVLEAFDVLVPLIPALKQIQPYAQVASVILKTAEEAYIVYASDENGPTFC